MAQALHVFASGHRNPLEMEDDEEELEAVLDEAKNGGCESAREARLNKIERDLAEIKILLKKLLKDT